MNDFLNAEERLRLKCVFLYSDKKADGDKELGLEEVGFVLGVSKERVRQIEKITIEKLKGMEQKFEMIKEWWHE